ncbi:MAG: hypothetical protein RL261_1552 [Pseudomonadota bacterium]|jgi:hypothetical protein
MRTFAMSVLQGLTAAALLAGCGQGDRVVVVRDAVPTAESTFVNDSLPAWHPALPEGHPPVPGMGRALPEGHPPVLPEGHPPISGGECPAGGTDGFSDTPASGPPAPDTIST